ncbi:MAG: 16S rRNA (adenine(1518)-N(6)/adenine(1519)-N(6))-dimethyltransferase RsmA [bacterium]|nr:16S rRNA (adenine(1518)-N(6)/adenine(1519)-N(6))-dimethyltransferase RsmA [bacterium]
MNDFKFKKKYGQNFLVDRNIVRKIVSDIDVKSPSFVLEVGCGDGKLTSLLCTKFDKVLGYEIDVEVKDLLYSNLASFSNYSIVFSDFLSCDVKKDIGNDVSNLYVIANLPYYVTTPIIEKLTFLNLPIVLMRFMVQKEVADRFCAKIGSKNYGSLTVFLNYHYFIKKEFIVSRNSFYPVPNVDSAVVSFFRREDKVLLKDIDFFYKLVRDSFKFKRKTLRNNLNGYDLVKVLEVLKKYGFDLSVRAEQLSVEIFCDIANNLC